jgi:hypothetical protein
VAREQRLQQATAALEVRQQRLQQAGVFLAEAQAETEKLRQQLTEERRKVQGRARSERQLMAGQRQRDLAELEQKGEVLRRQAEQVERSQLALQQMREDLSSVHRETLQTRLATEELWAQLTQGSGSSGGPAGALAEVRAKLAEEYRQLNADLAQQKQGLLALRSQLAEQYQGLIRQRQEFQRWAAQRQEAIDRLSEEQAARQEQQDQRESELSASLLRWQRERLEHHQQATRLASPASS